MFKLPFLAQPDTSMGDYEMWFEEIAAGDDTNGGSGTGSAGGYEKTPAARTAARLAAGGRSPSIERSARAGAGRARMRFLLMW